MTSQQRGSRHGVQAARFKRAARELVPERLIVAEEEIALVPLTRAQRRATADVLESVAALLRKQEIACVLTIVEEPEGTVAVTLKAQRIPKAGIWPGNGAGRPAETIIP